MRERLRKVAPHLIAAFVVFHTAALLAAAIPDVTMGLDRKLWKEPRVRRELSIWAERLGLERQQLEERLYTFGKGLKAARSAVLMPFQPYLDLTRQRQSWAMFIAGTKHRDRFQVRARACDNCPWEVLYERAPDQRALDGEDARGPAEGADDSLDHRVPGRDFLADIIEHPRVRSSSFRWGWPRGKRHYRRGCRAIARRAFTRWPDLTTVQCRFERSLSPDPRRRTHDAQVSWGRAVLVKNDATKNSKARGGAEKSAEKSTARESVKQSDVEKGDVVESATKSVTEKSDVLESDEARP